MSPDSELLKLQSERKLSRLERRFRRFVLDTPRWVATAILAAFITAVSVAAAGLCAGMVFGETGRFLRITLGLSFVIPLLIAPPIIITFIGLLHELAAPQRIVETLANTDALTGAYTRRHFDSVGLREFERARRAYTTLSLLVIDLDDFKRINDAYGHLAGDAVLRAVGQACRGAVRPYDSVARYGGEELAVLLPATPPEGAVRLAERLRGAIAALEVEVAPTQLLRVTASVGVASTDGRTESLPALFARADAAMYAAKRAGKNRVVLQ